jgi:hypothetical protein
MSGIQKGCDIVSELTREYRFRRSWVYSPGDDEVKHLRSPALLSGKSGRPRASHLVALWATYFLM